MVEAAAKEKIELDHIIGHKTEHRYHQDSKTEINRRMDAIAMRGRDPVPRRVKFVTYTLRYPEAFWIRVEGLNEHWKEARVEAAIINDREIQIETKNVTAL